MEIVLLWLDDLDDIVFCCVRSWALLRRLSLQIGMASSVALGGAELAARVEWSDALAAVAAASVAVWLCGAACTLAARMKPRSAIA